jgi:hypothetical protein
VLSKRHDDEMSPIARARPTHRRTCSQASRCHGVRGAGDQRRAQAVYSLSRGGDRAGGRMVNQGGRTALSCVHPASDSHVRAVAPTFAGMVGVLKDEPGMMRARPDRSGAAPTESRSFERRRDATLSSRDQSGIVPNTRPNDEISSKRRIDDRPCASLTGGSAASDDYTQSSRGSDSPPKPPKRLDGLSGQLLPGLPVAGPRVVASSQPPRDRFQRPSFGA